MVDFDVGVILPAAGSSERFGGSSPKQYAEILGRPLFLFALEGFLSIKFVKKVALVVDNVERAMTIVRESGLHSSQKVSFVLGGSSRHSSIKLGLQELQKHHQDSELRVVVIHDGVRPLVPLELVSEIVLAAERSGASGSIRPLVSTVLKPSSDSTMEFSLQRQAYCSSEMPQAFRFDVVYSAYSKCTQEELDTGTECLQLALDHCGVKAKLIPGPDDLWKVTYKKDLYTAMACIKEKSTDVCIISDELTETVVLLYEYLSGKVASVEKVIGTCKEKHEESGKTYNTIILFHTQEIQQHQHLLDFTALLNLDKQGIIIHVIDHSSVDGLQSMSVYNLHRNSCKMSHNYEKLHKGVVVVHCLSSNESKKLIDIVSTLIQSDPFTFSGQTLFL